MARKTFNVLFFIKKARLLKNGEAPVCMRITVNGCMVDVLVKRSSYFSFGLNRLKSYRVQFEQGEKRLVIAY